MPDSCELNAFLSATVKDVKLCEEIVVFIKVLKLCVIRNNTVGEH
jgi:hypothetical protein